MHTSPNTHPPRGLTLIELMVAIALGLLLVAVVIQIYAGTKATYNKQEDLSRLQENGRVALEVIGRAARISAFKSNPAAVYSTVFPASKLAIKGTPGAAGNGNDSLIIRFEGSGDGLHTPTSPDGTVVDCLGVAKDSNLMTYNELYIANNPATGRPALFCDTSDNGTVDGVPVVNEIENMRFLYGVDISGNGGVDFYVSASQVANWDQVVSLRIGLVASTPNTINPTAGASTYNVLGNIYSPVNDRRSRRLYTMIIALRNRTP